MRRGSAVLLTLAMLLTGCIGTTDEQSEEVAQTAAITDLPAILNVTVDQVMSFEETIVDAAIGYANDLYEPTMEVSDTGVIYVTGHTILVDTTGAPVFMSHDDGQSWEQLPFAASAQMPAGMHGATPPPSDEIFLTAGDDGQLWGVDITLLTFPVNGWCGDGAEHCYHNPNAYNRVDSTTDTMCSATSVNDRPWGAHANGKLLMVNNPGGGPMEIGVMDVPPANYADAPGNPATGPTWNTCASTGGYIPGIPDMREDHFFAVPQTEDGKLHVVTGFATDIFDVQQRHVFDVTNAGGGTSNYGQVVFDQEGTMFVGIRNNTYTEERSEDMFGEFTVREAQEGRLKLAVSQDDGETFETRLIQLDSVATSIYLDGNMAGPGALLTWAQEDGDATDWYAAHLLVGPDGAPIVENATLLVDDGPPPSAHVQGAAAGPDGRAYMVTFHGGYSPADQATPLHVWVQQDGPTLPVADDLPGDVADDATGDAAQPAT